MGRDVTPDMRSLGRRLSELSPEKRAVFEKLAGSQGSKVSRSLPIRPRTGSGRRLSRSLSSVCGSSIN